MVGKKEKIIGYFLLGTFLCCPFDAAAQAFEKTVVRKEKEAYDKKVNIGFKTGFRSTNYIVSEMSIDGVSYDNNLLQENYRLGYYAALYSRFNFKRHFLQPEISFNIDRAGMTLNEENSANTTTEKPTVKSTIYSLCFPILYGYDVVRRGPYSLSLFGGPKLEYLFKSNLDYRFPSYTIEEKLNPLNASIIAGVSVSISKIFFDFRYEQELFNISKSMTYTKQLDGSTPQSGDIKFHRRESCLSFSFGLLF
jgi:hypothetical protein